MIEQLVLIGCVYSKVETENTRNESIIARTDEPRWNKQSWLDRTREFFACGNLILSQRSACYIMTIGVIDECRKLGLGTQMINYTIDLVE